MARADKKIIRVLQILGLDVAVVAEVGDDNDGLTGKTFETKNGKIALGGVDSFWIVTGEKKSQLSARSDTLQMPAFTTAASSLVGRTTVPDFGRGLPGLGRSGKPNAASFATATRLQVAYSPRDLTHAELVDRLREGQLNVHSNGGVDAIEVRPNAWITASGFNRRSNGLYQFSSNVPIRAVPSVAIEGKPDCIHMASGLMVFRIPPQWSPATETDLRPDEEILHSAEEWLARATAAASEAEESEVGSLARLLKARIAGSIGTDEREDLEAALRVLSGRESLLELIPQLLSRDANWKESLREFERAERERVSDEVRRSLESESEEQGKRLEELRAQVIDAEAKLASAAHREVLLRNESDKHEARLQEKIAEAARTVESSYSGHSKALRNELERLRADVAELTQMATKQTVPETIPLAEPVAPPPVPVPAVETPPVANEEARLQILRELANDGGLSVAEAVAVLLVSTEGVPVLLGEKAAGLAARFADAIGGYDAAVVYCDPTRISLSDLLRGDELSGFAKAIETARARPDALIPVALCGITNGPCEYWLPQLIEMRRLGRVPRNTAFIASAGTDGMRVSVPKTVLRQLSPIKMADGVKSPGGTKFAGQWPFDGKGNGGRLQEALDLLTSKDVEPDFLVSVAKMLSKMPPMSGLKMADVAAVLLRQGKWNEELETTAEDGNLRFFTNIGG